MEKQKTKDVFIPLNINPRSSEKKLNLRSEMKMENVVSMALRSKPLKIMGLGNQVSITIAQSKKNDPSFWGNSDKTKILGST